MKAQEKQNKGLIKKRKIEETQKKPPANHGTKHAKISRHPNHVDMRTSYTIN